MLNACCFVASCRPHKAAPAGCLVVPSKDYSHGQARLRGLSFVKGDSPKTITRAQKKAYEK